MSIQRFPASQPSLFQYQPAWIVEKPNPPINAILQEREMPDKLAGMDIERVDDPSLRMASIVSTEASKWQKVIEDAGIEVE